MNSQTDRTQAEIAEAIHATLISPVRRDDAPEQTNVVDALALIARGLFAVAEAIHESSRRPGAGPEAGEDYDPGV